MKKLQRKYFVSYVYKRGNDGQGYGRTYLLFNGSFSLKGAEREIEEELGGIISIVLYYKFVGWAWS